MRISRYTVACTSRPIAFPLDGRAGVGVGLTSAGRRRTGGEAGTREHRICTLYACHSRAADRAPPRAARSRPGPRVTAKFRLISEGGGASGRGA